MILPKNLFVGGLIIGRIRKNIFKFKKIIPIFD